MGSCSEGDHRGGICRPILTSPEAIELGKAGVFSWSCQGGDKAGSGYYVVFIRPAGTYVLLKVPEHRTSFEFTPDAVGAWRWIVINTDPDGTKPDVESESTNFQVVRGRILHEHDRK
ncbi:MAG TPA: hypothetical protein VK463_07420 [Desulfomonilaceae bacterium]|nr:hypothetical protein [Desulfomonilaceae bacterium]